MTRDGKAVAAAYVETWKAHDVDGFRSLSADDVEFIGPIPTADWIHVQDGKIARIQVAFDPRPVAPPGR